MVQCSTYNVARVVGTLWVARCILRFLKGKDESQVLPPNGLVRSNGVRDHSPCFSSLSRVLDERARDRRSGTPRPAMQGWKAC